VLIQHTSTAVSAASPAVAASPSSVQVSRTTRICAPASLDDVVVAVSAADKHGLRKLHSDSPLEALVLHCSVLPGLSYADGASLAQVSHISLKCSIDKEVLAFLNSLSCNFVVVAHGGVGSCSERSYNGANYLLKL
jgi:hypothetical protein